MKVNCRYKDAVFIHADGVMHRCCYIPADIYKPINRNTYDSHIMLKEYQVNNIHNLLKLPPGSLLELAETSPYFKGLEESWKDDRPPVVCVKNCAIGAAGHDVDD